MDVLFDFDSVARKPKITSDALPQIREVFSIEDKALVFMKRRFNRNMPVRKYAITNKGHFDLPFFSTIYNEIKLSFPSLTFSFSSKFLEIAKTKEISADIVNLKLTPRDYQIEAATIGMKKGRGVIVLPTSAGKTLVIALMINTILSKHSSTILILVPDIQLVQQTYQDFLDYGLDNTLISKWTGSYEFTNTKIVVANHQILLSDKQDTTVLNSFEYIFVDECHKMASAEKISKLIKKLNCSHIFGFTGSMPLCKFDVWTINRIFGPILYTKKSIELRNDQYISKVRVIALNMEYKDVPKFTTPSMLEPTAGYEEETQWLHTNEFRNSTISKLINRLETNTLILVDRIVHGEHLLTYLQTKTTKQVYFVQGSVELEEREKIKSIMEETNDVVCIAISKIFSTGISIKNLHNIVFASIGKARIKIIQSIGRSLRLHHTKEMANIFDIADNCLRYGQKHFIEREQLYVAEKIPIITTKIVQN